MAPGLADKLPALLRDVAAAVSGDVYLVGGAVRDVLLGRRVSDWDLACTAAEELAQAVAAATGTRPITLRSAPLVLRVPAAELGHVDVIELPTGDVTHDLLRRDFTVNALALNLASGAIVDPVGGLADLEAGVLRGVSESVFSHDPTRILRAYRLCAELGFGIHDATRQAIRRDRSLLAHAPPQRWGREMLLLCAVEGPVAQVLSAMDEDGVMDQVLPAWSDMRGVTQGPYHHLDVLGHTLAALGAADVLIASPEEAFALSAGGLRVALRSDELRAAVRAGVLLHDVGKPSVRTVGEDGRIWFRGHEGVGAEIAEHETKRWGWPKAVREAVVRVVRLHMRLLDLARDAVLRGQGPTDAALRRLLRDAEAAVPALYVAGAADLLAARGPATDQDLQGRILTHLDTMLARSFQISSSGQRSRLVSGHDLMRHLGIPPGKLVGALLEAIEAAREEGRLTTAEEAIALARAILAGGASGGASEDTGETG